MKKLNYPRAQAAAFFAAGWLLILAGSGSAAVHYVDLNSINATPPYLAWTTAASNIQDAVDAAIAGDEVVVTNGVYATGGRARARVAVDKALTLRSVNGPQSTIIQGQHQVAGASNGEGAIRCVYLTNGASLCGFTLTNGVAYGGGGGLACESTNAVASDCVVSGNSAYVDFDFGLGGGAYGGTLNNCTVNGNSAAEGGGAYQCTLNNCTLSGNSAGVGGGAFECILNKCKLSRNVAHGDGGGAYRSTLENCVLTGNSADDWGAFGGGAYDCTLDNCTLSGNRAGYYDFHGHFQGGGGGACACTLNNCIAWFNIWGGNYDSDSTLTYCCTTPLPTNGVGNIDSDPLFVDTNGWANLRLQAASPCINAGDNASAAGPADLDGHPRISGGTVDIGAYEFVFTPAMNLGRLILLVEDADMTEKNKQPFLAILNAALASLGRGNAATATRQLLAFQNQVRAQIATSNLALAQELIRTTREIIQALGMARPGIEENA